MDRKLVAWARMVKTRRPRRTSWYDVPLWLFTDKRLADPAATIRHLSRVPPAGLVGIILRGEHTLTVGGKIAALCRRRRMPLLIAGDVRRAHLLRAGLHLASGRRPAATRLPARLSASAHNPAEIRRAERAGARLIFLSPVFATASHPGARPLGPHRAAAFGRVASRRVRLLALGGIDGRTARLLSTRFSGAGAITALETP